MTFTSHAQTMFLRRDCKTSVYVTHCYKHCLLVLLFYISVCVTPPPHVLFNKVCLNQTIFPLRKCANTPSSFVITI